MSVPELSIIIVNWNGENLLPDCLGSIAEHPPTSAYEVIVVDNASTDQSIAWLESDDRRRLIPDERFRLIKNSENAGFGKANNQAMRRSNSEYIFL
ncbi:MAG: glycosyltransferase family 2 protein, partial [Acidobacteriota bacterium]